MKIQSQSELLRQPNVRLAIATDSRAATLASKFDNAHKQSEISPHCRLAKLNKSRAKKALMTHINKH